VSYESPFEREHSVGSIIATIGGVVGGWIGSRYLGLAFFLPFVAAGLGLFIANWHAKRHDVDGTGIKLLVWVNLIAWVLPPAGLLTGVAYATFSKTSAANRKLYLILGLGCAALAFLNGAVGIWLAINSAHT
jgi:hypothetical protein